MFVINLVECITMMKHLLLDVGEIWRIKMNKKIWIVMFALLILSSFANVSAWDLLNDKESKDIRIGDKYTLGDREVDYKELWTKYKPIEVSTWFGLGETIFKGALIEHTESCGANCLSEVELYLSNDGVLVEDVIFKRSFDDEKSWEDWTGFTNWNIQIENKNRYVEQDTYSYECSKTGKVSENGTAIEECSQVITGKETIDTGEWLPYSLGSKVDAGNYKVKLVGSKKTDTILDWQFITQGKILSEWATWGRVNASLGDGLVAQYRLNTYGNQTDVRDTLETNNGVLVGKTFNDGTVSGGVTIDDGAMVFDGVDGVVNLNTNLASYINSTKLFSLSAWVKTNEVASQTWALAIGGTGANKVSLTKNADYKVRIEVTDTSNNPKYATSINPINHSEWTLITGVYNGSSIFIYINGVLSSSTLVGNINDVSGLSYMGARGTNNYWNGSIDDVQIHNRALTQDEITAQYNLGRGKYALATDGLVFQASGRDYAGTEATPTTIYDTNHLTEGKVNQAFGFDGVNDYVNFGNTIQFNQSFSISGWVYALDTPTGDNRGAFISKSSSIFQVQQQEGARWSTWFNGNEIADGGRIPIQIRQWHFLTYTHNGTHLKVYSNGEIYGESNGYALALPSSSSTDLFIGSNALLPRFFNGSLDDVRIYNRSLTEQEIQAIYNEGLGTEGVASAWVELQSPANGSIAYTPDNDFIAYTEVEGGASPTNMSFCSNLTGSWECGDTITFEGSIIGAHSVDSSTTTQSISTQMGVKFNVSENISSLTVTKFASSQATRALLYQATGDFQGTLLANGTINGNTAQINYSLTSGVNYFLLMDNYGSSYTTAKKLASYPYTSSFLNMINTVQLNTNAFDDYIYNVEGIDSTEPLFNTSSTQTWSKTIPAGSTLWNIYSCDSDGDCGFSVANYTVTLDATAPTIEINSGNETQNYGSLTQNHTINFTITDTNLDSCWLGYNETNTTIDCATGVSNSTSFPLVLGLYNATIYANDTAGNVQSQGVSWDYKVFENGRTHNATTFETKNETLTINITSNNLTNAWLNFNNALYPTQGTNIRTSTINMENVNVDTNRTFYWILEYGNENITTYTSQVLVKNYIVNYTGTKQYVNITIRDEFDDSIINSTTLDSLFEYYIDAGGYIQTFEDVKVNDGIYSLNANPNINRWSADGRLYYFATGYQPRYFFLDDQEFTNSSITQQTLYLLFTGDGILVRYKIFDNLGQPIIGARITAYKIVGSTQTLVEQVLTDDEGEASLFLNPNYFHRIVISKEGCTDIDKQRRITTSDVTNEFMTCTGISGGVDSNYDLALFNNVSYIFTPIKGTFTTEEVITFGANINDPSCVLESATYKLKRGGTDLISLSSANPCGESLTQSLNLSSYPGTLTAYGSLVIDGKSITYTYSYRVVDVTTMVWEGSNVSDLLTKISDANFGSEFGLTPYSKLFIAIIIIFGALAFISTIQGVRMDAVGTSVFVNILVLLFSLINFMNLGIDSTNPVVIMASKYGIWMVVSIITGITIIKGGKE
jgi:hypothetical protein